MENNVILSVRDLDVKFSLRGRTLHAIRGVSLDVHKGESLAIVGESGSGKSVFTKTFMGLLDDNGSITGGSILYNGQDLAKYTTEKQWLTIRGRDDETEFRFTKLTPTHKARTWLLDPRAPKVEPPEQIKLLREGGVNRHG